MGQPAYNFEAFEVSEKPQPQLRAVKGGKHARRVRWAQTRMVFCGIIFVALVCGLLYSNVQKNELTTDIQTAQNALAEAMSENDYLRSELESTTGMRNVEELASGELGLMKVDNSQITYVNLESESVIVTAENGIQRFFSGLQAGLMRIWRNLG